MHVTLSKDYARLKDLHSFLRTIIASTICNTKLGKYDRVTGNRRTNKFYSKLISFFVSRVGPVEELVLVLRERYRYTFQLKTSPSKMD